MNYKTLKSCIIDLEKSNHLIRIKEPVSRDLEIAAIHRQVFEKKGPALLFENVLGSKFPVVSNLFGTMDRTRFIFRKTLKSVKALIQMRADPFRWMKHPGDLIQAPIALQNSIAKKSFGKGVLKNRIRISDLPAIKSWPNDGGDFITLPQVYSEDPDQGGIYNSNLGMYRIQINGNRYKKNQEVGLHYQIHRGIGIHHTRAINQNKELKVSIFVGGPPAHCFGAVMPLPEAVPEIAFCGALAGRGFRYSRTPGGYLVSTDADFCITGTISKFPKPEGPFGDHLGYYALKHDFPVLKVENVFHRDDAIWPTTVVGRPPAEDSSFGALIQEITGPMVPVSIPGLIEMHAIDSAGVHPLMLAIAKERYTPWQKLGRPQEILRVANAILGFGHASLTKYLFITNNNEAKNLDTHDIPAYFSYILKRINLTRDLHFITKTTMDTLDYSAGQGLNHGSKVIIAAAGPAIRKLTKTIPASFSMMAGFKNPKLLAPGILVITSPKYKTQKNAQIQISGFCKQLKLKNKRLLTGLPLVILCDDSDMVARNFHNFLWVCFTRSDPAADIHGVDSFIENKHWGCQGPLIIDARTKPHHAPALLEDPGILDGIKRLKQKGSSLYGIL